MVKVEGKVYREILGSGVYSGSGLQSQVFLSAAVSPLHGETQIAAAVI